MLWHKTIGAGGISQGLSLIFNTNAFYTDDNTFTIDISGASLQEGDLILTSVATRWNADIDYSVTGFTELVDIYVNGTDDCNLGLFYKVSDGTETSINVTTNVTGNTQANTYIWRGADTLSAIDQEIEINTATGATLVTSPDVTTVTDNAVVMQIIAAAGSAANPLTSITQPTNTDNFTVRGGVTTQLAVCSSVLETAGTTSLNDFGGGTGYSGNTSATITIAIRPNQQEEDTWTPADITTELWYDAADLSTVTLGYTSGVQNVTVSRWNDKSGNGHDVTNSGGINLRNYTYGQFNGHNSIRFLNSWLRERVATLGISTNFSILAVGSAKTTEIVQYGRLFSLKTSSDAQDWDNNFSINMYYNSGVAIDCGSSNATKQSVANNEAFMLEAYCSSGSLDQYFNGSLTDSAINTSVNLSVEDIGIGVAYDFTSGQIWTGDISEIIVIPTNSSSDRQKAEGYLAHKWGIADDLPSGHPYKSAPPTS